MEKTLQATRSPWTFFDKCTQENTFVFLFSRYPATSWSSERATRTRSLDWWHPIDPECLPYKWRLSKKTIQRSNKNACGTTRMVLVGFFSGDGENGFTNQGVEWCGVLPCFQHGFQHNDLFTSLRGSLILNLQHANTSRSARTGESMGSSVSVRKNVNYIFQSLKREFWEKNKNDKCANTPPPII